MDTSSHPTSSSDISRPIQTTQDLTLPGIEVSVFSKFGLAVVIFSVCVWVLLWSRNQVQQTKVALSQAQHQLDRAIKKQQLLELELNMILSPVSIEEQVREWKLQPASTIIDIYEPNTP